MPFCRTGHLQVYYQSIGKQSPTLLLLHGWGQSWETWAAYIPELSQHYRLILVDLPGFGQSDSPTQGWDMLQYSHWLAAFLRELKVDQLNGVIGHSFGGKLATFAWCGYETQLALPPLKEGMFLISPSGICMPLSVPKKFLQYVLALLPLTLKRKLLGGIRRFLYEKLLGETDYLHSTAFQEQTLHKILPQDIRDAVGVPSAIPLHFCWGKQDSAVPLWMAYKFAKISEQSEVFVLPNATHFSPFTHQKEILQWLKAWLQHE